SVMSRTTRSGAAEMALARPSSPSLAVMTSYPSSSRLSRRPSNICGSSSITRMRFVTVGLSSVQREMQREGAPRARRAADAHQTAVASHHVIDDREAEPGALRPRSGVGLHAVELAEDLAVQPRGNADAAIGHAHEAVTVLASDVDLDLAVVGRILHRVREQ